MPSLPATPPPDALANAARVAHDLGLAGLLGGNLFGRVAFHPAVEIVSDKAERGEVVNDAWRRYGTVNSLSLAAVTLGWAGARATEARSSLLSPRERKLARCKDALVAGVVVTGLATALQGVRFARQAPGGAVPLETGSAPAAETPPVAARLKRGLNVLGAAGGLLEVALVGVNAALAQSGHTRPPARRRLPRRTR